jgi:O-antigen/teichoic acid export membrane protein
MQKNTVVFGGLSLRHNFAWTFAGNVIYAACQWAILVVIAKTMPPAALGQFALGLAVTAPILIFAYQGLRELQATDARHQFEFRDYFRFRLLSATLALIIIACLAQAFNYPPVVIVVGISKALESLCDLLYGKYQQHERMDWIAISLMLRGVLAVIAVAALLYATHSIQWGAAGLIIANVCVLAGYDWRRPAWLSRSAKADGQHAPGVKSIPANAPHPNIRATTMYRLAMLGLPLGLAQMLNSFSVNIPRYFLERHSGEAALGIFAAIMYLLVAGRTMIAALAQSCVPRLAKLYVRGDRQAFKSLLFKQLVFALALGAAGILFSLIWGAPFLQLIYRPEYGEYAVVLLLAMVTAAVNHLAEFTGTALTAARSIRIQPFILGTCAAVGWLSSSLLVPHYGIAGASWGILLIGICQLCLYICALVYVLGRTNWQRESIRGAA